MLDRRLAVHPQVAVRPEPFGALAYHYGNRKLVFLQHRDMVRVLDELDGQATLGEILDGCAIDESRWPSFDAAMTRLIESEMLHDDEHEPAGVAR